MADVLPKLPPPKLSDIDALLTDEEHRQLYEDLEKMARQRRAAEAASATIVMH